MRARGTPLGCTCLVSAAVALAASGCGSGDDEARSETAAQESKATVAAALPRGREHVSLEPGEFTTDIDNPYFPIAPGNRWVYREVEDGEVQRVEVTVTNRTRMVDGIEARVVHDRVSKGGETVEDTLDWYAQDREGNVWYLGESTAEYENGRVKTRAGSFEAGVGGAEAGVIMPAQPRPGMRYREELLAGEAEDRATITSVGRRVRVPFGSYERVVTTANTTPLEPNLRERKWYAPGIGPVREDLLRGGHGRTVLVDFTRGAGRG